MNPSLIIEFHASQDAWRQPGAACIHHCLLRIKREHGPGSELYPKGLKSFSDILARFAYLETVVIETVDGFETDDVQPLIEALRKFSMVEVQCRTFDGAHKLALEAKKNPSHSTSTGLLSPFWCLQRDTDEWDRW